MHTGWIIMSIRTTMHCGFVKYMNFKELTSIVRRYRVVALFTGSPAAVRIAALTWARRLSVPVLAYRLQPLLGLEIQKSRNINVTHFTLLVHVGTHTILRQYTCLSCDFLFSIFMLLHHCFDWRMIWIDFGVLIQTATFSQGKDFAFWLLPDMERLGVTPTSVNTTLSETKQTILP